MIESAERASAGEERAGRPCGWCEQALTATDQAATCTSCGVIHHEACWDGELGCSRASCLNAPLKRLDAPPRNHHGVASGPKPRAGAGVSGADPARDIKSAPSDPKKRRAPPASGLRPCIGCGAELSEHQQVCDLCLTINTPDGLYHGPKTTAPSARQALIYGLVGLVVCGPILGPAAISEANKAKVAIRRDPRLEGEGLANAGLALGILALVLWLWVLVSRVGGTP